MSECAKKMTEKHPCYNANARQYARMHLPVAPNCNLACNYCNRKYDCANECRPGVTSEVLSPKQALERYKEAKEKVENLSVVGIAGPGDALCDFKKTKETIERIKEYDASVIFCLSTNGLMIPQYAEEIIGLGIRHVTITINAVDPMIGASIYRKVYFDGKLLTGIEGARVLLKQQMEGLRILASRGVLCKVNTVAVKTVNDFHIEDVAKAVKQEGAFMTNIMPMIPVKGSYFEHMPIISKKEVNVIRHNCKEYISQMYHCTQCRADAVGTLGSCRAGVSEDEGKKAAGL